jgi:hypothetical protein
MFESDIDLVHESMTPGAYYPAAQLYTAYAEHVKKEGRKPVYINVFATAIRLDNRFHRKRGKSGTLFARVSGGQVRHIERW